MRPEAINSLAVRQLLTEVEREIGRIEGGIGKRALSQIKTVLLTSEREAYRENGDVVGGVETRGSDLESTPGGESETIPQLKPS